MTDFSLLTLLLESLARLERAGRPARPRLTDPEWTAWRHFRRKLGFPEFIQLLCEDAALAFPVPFDFSRWHHNPLAGLRESEAEGLVRQAAAASDEDAAGFLRAAARAIGRQSGGKLADLPRIQPYQRTLELPGTSGRAALSLCLKYPDLAFDQTFTFVADSDADVVLIGLAAIELRSNPPQVLSRAELYAAIRAGALFDRVIGLGDYGPARSLAADFAFAEVLWV